jgi:uncharacterized protein YecE (DUF72 family)
LWTQTSRLAASEQVLVAIRIGTSGWSYDHWHPELYAPGLPARDRLAYFLRLAPGWLRLTVEFRHPSWHCEEVFALLEAHGAAFCVMSGANLPCILRATTDFAYVRMHGPDHHHLYAGSYSDADLTWWADRIQEWNATGKDVLVYFNNDGNANAVRNARTLRTLVAD